MADIQHAWLFLLILHPQQTLLINPSTLSIRRRYRLTALPKTELQIATVDLTELVSLS